MQRGLFSSSPNLDTFQLYFQLSGQQGLGLERVFESKDLTVYNLNDFEPKTLDIGGMVRGSIIFYHESGSTLRSDDRHIVGFKLHNGLFVEVPSSKLPFPRSENGNNVAMARAFADYLHKLETDKQISLLIPDSDRPALSGEKDNTSEITYLRRNLKVCHAIADIEYDYFNRQTLSPELLTAAIEILKQDIAFVVATHAQRASFSIDHVQKDFNYVHGMPMLSWLKTSLQVQQRLEILRDNPQLVAALFVRQVPYHYAQDIPGYTPTEFRYVNIDACKSVCLSVNSRVQDVGEYFAEHLSMLADMHRTSLQDFSNYMYGRRDNPEGTSDQLLKKQRQSL